MQSKHTGYVFFKIFCFDKKFIDAAASLSYLMANKSSNGISIANNKRIYQTFGFIIYNEAVE
jgi:hypothetical protein